jgi:signal transduction histidine kinase
MLSEAFRRPRWAATAFRLIGLALVVWSIATSEPTPAASGRGLVVLVLSVIATAAWLVWTARPTAKRDLYAVITLLALAGGVLISASPPSAASAFVFAAVIVAAIRFEPLLAVAVTGVALCALALGVLVYDRSWYVLLGYGLGLIGAALLGANRRQQVARAEQAELLLAQTQRSQEEQLRAARLDESARIAREIHDVLAHTLAGLAIQLEATKAMVESGADRDELIERLGRAHALAREGLDETRRAVGALRGEPVALAPMLEALVADYRLSDEGAAASLSISGEPALLDGPTGLAVVRVAQEALTNVRKHAPGNDVAVELRVADEVVLRVLDTPRDGSPPRAVDLSGLGGGYGLRGMRERTEILGGSLHAGPDDAGGWVVELRLRPAPVEAVR